MTPTEAAGSRRKLLRWYDEFRRDLPWRRSSDPYAIWVSEIMLQQTRVETVIPYFHRFLAAFPDVRALADAEQDEVLACWTGLGYYRRARSLHGAARAIVERFDGALPVTVAELSGLPGIGRYTAGAVASIAFDVEAPIVDGNVRRVFARLYGIGAATQSYAALDRRIWSIAEQWVRGARPGDFNQALMELGATVCTPAAPECGICPVSACCAARESGRPENFPAAAARPAMTRHEVAVALIRRGDKVLLERPGKDNPLRGSWELPARIVAAKVDPVESLRGDLRRRHGLELRVQAEAGAVRHGIMSRSLRLRVFPAAVRRGRASGNDRLRWVELGRLSEIAVSGATLKCVSIGTGFDIRNAAKGEEAASQPKRSHRPNPGRGLPAAPAGPSARSSAARGGRPRGSRATPQVRR